jgi:hypothetical protein
LVRNSGSSTCWWPMLFEWRLDVNAVQHLMEQQAVDAATQD